jgi:hypothetical protein
MQKNNYLEKEKEALQYLDTPPLILLIIGILIWPYWLIGSLIFIPLTYRYTRNLKTINQITGYRNETIDKIHDSVLVYLGKSKIAQNSNKNKNKKR